MALFTSLNDLIIKYNPKFELYFSDQNNRPVLVQILQKNYVGDVYNLVGTDNPVEIIWDSDDDIYSPIKGSRCKLNFYVTDFSVIDDFYKADEREYKVNVYYYSSTGGVYEDTLFKWDTTQVIYNAEFGAAVFWEPYWSGFIVVDRWQEAVTTAPYPVSLEAIDGLGTLQGFEAPNPFKNQFFVTDDEYLDPVKSLFYYITEILKKTGHQFDIYIANDIRKFDGSTDTISAKFDLEETSTLFHDITVNDIPLYDKNLNSRDCKEVLEYILKLTNSRIFQSYGRWYIISNTNLIDNRIDQQTVCPSGVDLLIDNNANLNFGEEEAVEPPALAPNIFINGSTSVTLDGRWYFYITNIGGDITSATWTLPDGSTVTDNNRIPKISFTPEAGHDGQTISISVSNATGSDSDSKTLSISESTAGPTDFGGVFTIMVLTENTDGVAAYPIKNQLMYSAAQVGDPFTFEVYVSALVYPFNYEYTSTDQLGAVCRFTKSTASDELYTVTKELLTTGVDRPTIKVTISGNIPSFPQTNYLHLSGSPVQKQFTTTVNVTNNASNCTADKTQMVFTGIQGSQFQGNVTLTASGDREFTDSGNISGLIVGNYEPVGDLYLADNFFSQSLLLQNIFPDQVYNTYTIGVDGKIGAEDQTVTLVLTGAPQGISGISTSATFSPAGPFSVDANAGSFYIKVTHTGKINITTDGEWINLNTISPTSFGAFNQARGLTFSADSETSNNFYISWKANTEQPAGRFATIYAEDADTGDELATIEIDQDYLATDSYNNNFNWLT